MGVLPKRSNLAQQGIDQICLVGSDKLEIYLNRLATLLEYPCQSLR